MKITITASVDEWSAIEQNFGISFGKIADFLASKQSNAAVAPTLAPPSNQIFQQGARRDMYAEEFADGALKQYIQENARDPWRGTPFEGYAFMNPKQKGEFGERFATKLLEKAGHTVERAHSATAGYDRLVNGERVEIKFSLANRDRVTGGVKKDVFVLNHVSKDKEWSRLLFVGVNPKEEDLRLVWFTRPAFREYTTNASAGKLLFNLQQGGKKVKNDDWMCTKIPQLMKCDWVNVGLNGW